MLRKRNKGVYAFIDSQNLNLGTQRVGWKLDWKKFRQYLEKEHNVVKAYLFVGYLPEYEDMYKQMHEFGYMVVLKPTQDLSKIHQKKDDDKPVKGNIDAELVLYAMKEMPNYSQAVIVSGDGDFLCLAEYLSEKSRLKHIMAPNRNYSSLYNPYEKYVIRLDKLRSQLSYKSIKPRTDNPKNK